MWLRSRYAKRDLCCAKNLHSSDETCLNIAEDGVALVLNNHTITGPDLDTDGISDIGNDCTDPFTNVVITDGTVQHFRNGVALSNTTLATISDIKATHNNVGIITECGESTIDHVVADDNAQIGSLLLRDNNILVNSQADLNGYYGFYFFNTKDVPDSSSNTLINNSASHNGDDGIRITGDQNTLVSNTVTDNGRYGISVRCFSELVRNKLLNNDFEDLHTYGGTCSTVDNEIH
jgi:parallel beta-helix repeat protein